MAKMHSQQSVVWCHFCAWVNQQISAIMVRIPNFMPDQTIAPPAPPVIPSGQEIYAYLMGAIEPDLAMDNAAREAKYAGEADEQRKARFTRYQKAFAEYKKQAAEAFARMHREVEAYSRAAVKYAEGQAANEERTKLKHLEEQFSLDA